MTAGTWTPCRLCRAPLPFEPVLSLAPTPPANAFRTPDDTSPILTHPLDLHLCPTCGHLQLGCIVPPRELFSDYLYASGTSKSFVAHFEEYADWCAERFELRPNDLVVEIGSNDGTMLEFFQTKYKCRVIGVDPGRPVAKLAQAKGVPTITQFFDKGLGQSIYQGHGPARLVVANNVLAHVPNLSGVVDGVRALLGGTRDENPHGHLVFEVQYLLDLVEKHLFDMIYHEHVSYHAVWPLSEFFESNRMRLTDVHRVATHGGSIRCVVDANWRALASDAVDDLEDTEAECGLFRAATYQHFKERIDTTGEELRKLLQTERDAGRRIVGFGAPAKATTLLTQYGLADFLDYIVDDSPLKQGLKTPDGRLEVHPVEYMATWNRGEWEYTTVLILAWNFVGPIMERLRPLSDSGLNIIVPLPVAQLHRGSR